MKKILLFPGKNYILRCNNKLFALLSIGITMLIGYSESATALPFKPTPQAFTYFLNNVVNWSGPDTIYFENLTNCSGRKGSSPPDGHIYDVYSCKDGYVTYFSPMGRNVCRLYYASYTKDLTLNSRPDVSFHKTNCLRR